MAPSYSTSTSSLTTTREAGWPFRADTMPLRGEKCTTSEFGARKGEPIARDGRSPQDPYSFFSRSILRCSRLYLRNLRSTALARKFWVSSAPFALRKRVRYPRSSNRSPDLRFCLSSMAPPSARKMVHPRCAGDLLPLEGRVNTGRPLSATSSPHYARATCSDRGYGRPSGRPRVFLRQTPRDELGTSRTSLPCDVLNKYASGPVPRYRGTVARWHDHLHDFAAASRA
jgi:hypothetical protein